MAVDVQSFRTEHLPQVQALINAHLDATAPGWIYLPPAPRHHAAKRSLMMAALAPPVLFVTTCYLACFLISSNTSIANTEALKALSLISLKK